MEASVCAPRVKVRLTRIIHVHNGAQKSLPKISRAGRLEGLGSVDFVDFNQTDDDFFSLGVTKVLKKAADATGDPVLKAAKA